MSIFSFLSFYFKYISLRYISMHYFSSYITIFGQGFLASFYLFSISKLFSVSKIKFDDFILLGDVKSSLGDLKNLSFPVLLIEVTHFYFDDFLLRLELKSLRGFSLNTIIYFLDCFIFFNSFLKLFISASRDPLGLVIDAADLTGLSLFIGIFFSIKMI